jgi:hypothetical protein
MHAKAVHRTALQTAHGGRLPSAAGGTWPVLVIWFAIVVINMAIFRVGPFRHGRRFAD